MKKATILAIAFVIGTSSIFASKDPKNNLNPPTKKGSIITKDKTLSKQKSVKNDFIIMSKNEKKQAQKISYKELQNKLRTQAVKNYSSYIIPEIIRKE